MNTTEAPETPEEKARATRQAGRDRAVRMANGWIDEARARAPVAPPKQRPPQTWYTGDPHLGHERIIELCDRPFGSVGEMNDAILDRINSVVARQDTLVVVGDVLLGPFEESVKLLQRIRAGRIRLLPGNHDRWSLAYGHGGSAGARATKRMLFAAEYAARRSEGVVRVEKDRVPSAWPVLLGGRQVLLSHYPYVGDSRHGPDRHRELRPLWAGQPLIHGHVHGRWKIRGRMFNVGVDVNDFAPVAESELRDWLATLGADVNGQNAANQGR